MKWPLLVLSFVLLATFALSQSPPSAQAQITPRASIFDTTPSQLTEQSLHGAQLTVRLHDGGTYASTLSPGQFTLTPATSGLSVSSVQRQANTFALLTLAFTGDISNDLQISVEVAAAATSHSAALTTGPVTVTQAQTTPPAAATISATDPSPLTERTLNDARLTVDLTGTTYASSLSPGQFSLQASPFQIGDLSVSSVQR